MESFGIYLIGFGMGTAKFMFAAASLMPFNLSYWEIVISTFLGAFVSFNVFYFSAGLLMERAKLKRIEKLKDTKGNQKKTFSRINKMVVRIKLSPVGYLILVIIGPMVMSIPIGSIVLAKFYRRLKLTYWLEAVSLFFWANMFTLLNFYLFK